MRNMESTIKGIGCDIVNVARIETLSANVPFLKKVYTDAERHYCENKPAEIAAGIWAAKEAVSKALKTGFCGFTAKDVEVRHDDSGQPRIVLFNGAKKRADLLGIRMIHISISHEAEQALAFAIAE